MNDLIVDDEDEIKIAPEILEIAQAYIKFLDIDVVAKQYNVPVQRVSNIINKPEVKRFIDTVFINQGYRNRFKLADVLDEILESKLQEARESEFYSKKDILEVIALIHKITDDHAKQSQKEAPKTQTNIQINDNSSGFGEGNYGKLMEVLINGKQETNEQSNRRG